MRLHGWIGLGIILGAEAALFAGSRLVGEWFTPVVWTGYVLLMDAVVARLTGRSYLTTDRVEGVLVALTSVGGWWLFEWYNAPRFWRGGADAAGLWWQYHTLEPSLFLRRVGYDWAFATIFPALFLTAAALRATVFRGARVSPWQPPAAVLNVFVAAGAVCVVLPLVVVSAWLVPLVWAGWALLLEPLNARAGRPSWLADLRRGDASRVLALLASGLLCGVLWEFWNYWALTKWTYSLPYAGDLKLFEMPVLGYLGFPPFALECFAMYHWLRGRLGEGPRTPVL
ncbi:MAG: hypothetical protein HYU25_16865 [Candidatus Rokubacteria bacterium]|nr:hypothetical protein [Candidatus Rokubacteria bacterium]